MSQPYKGTNVAVSYDEKRCTHAANCVKALPRVFDVSRVPWIDPDRATPDEVRAAVAACPSGALKVTTR